MADRDRAGRFHSLTWLRKRRRALFRVVTIASAIAVASVTVGEAPAFAVPTTHEITANWADVPAPTDAPYGVTRTAEFRINTNDASDPYVNGPVENVRATLTATNGAFASIPAVCKTSGVTPASAISNNGTQLLCNLGTITEGTATALQAPVKANGAVGSNLSVSGTVTSDSAIASAGPAATSPLPITGSHGMDLMISAPNQHYQQATLASRTGGNRPSIVVDYGVAMTAGSVPGPPTYTFDVDIAVSVPGQLPNLQWEGCAPVDSSAQATGIPYSASSFANRTNAPTCSISGSGTHYTVTLSGLDYSLQRVPTVDSLGNAISSTTNFVASGQLIFSYSTAITQNTGVTFTASPSQFTFSDGVTQPETNTGNNVSGTSLVLPGVFAINWQGGPTAGRSPWDAGLFVAPGTAEDLTLPWPAAGTSTNPGPYTFRDQPLVSLSDSVGWSTYTGAGGADMAGSCNMVQNPAAFTPRYVDFAGVDGASYTNMTTAHLWYRTDAIDTKTETCGQPVGVAGSPWISAPLPAGCPTQTHIPPAYADNQCVVSLPAGVTAVKMTWNPAVDKQFHHLLRVWGFVPDTAPVGAESWTVGAFNAPYDVTTAFPGYPNLNNYVNYSTNPNVIANIPGSTYGPNTNGQRDAMRIQGPNGAITKTTPDTTAQPGVPVTFNLTAESLLAVESPPNQTFTVTDTLPTGMTYVDGSGTPTPALSVNGSGQQVLTYTFTDVPANTPQPITFQAQTAPNSAIAPGTVLTNVAQIDVAGDNRAVVQRQATASVRVPNSAATTLGKSSDDGVLSFYGDSSAWALTISSQDPLSNSFTDTIDVLPYLGDGRGTTIDGSFTIDSVTAPAGATVYYTDASPDSLDLDPRDPSNGGTPGSISGNTVGWSTTKPTDVTGIRIIGPALAPGETQTVRIAYTTPTGTDCAAPAADDNKPGQVLVNSATTIAGHTALPMQSSSSATIGNCYAVDIQKYVLAPGGDPTDDADWLDADTAAQYPRYAAGDAVPYRLVVTNKGSGDLTDVVVTDSLLPACSYTVPALAAGDSFAQECAGSAVVGTTVNTATVETTPAEGGTLTAEDPAGIVVPEPYTVSKTASPASTVPVPVGGTITYTIVVSEPESSAAPFPDASFTDDLSNVFDDATYNGDVEATAGTASVTGNQLSWSIPDLMPGQTAIITYSVTVSEEALTTGDQTLANKVTTPPGLSNCDAGSTDPACSTINLVPSYTVEKTVDATSAVAGDVLSYTITVRNTGPIAYPSSGPGAASLTDSLIDVVDDGALVPNSATATAGVVSQLETDLLWTGPLDVGPAPGAVVTIQYQVSVTGDGDDHLINSVVPSGTNGSCAAAAACETDTPVLSYEVSKSATPAVAYPGGVVNYTITIRNTGAVPYTDVSPATFTDDLANVLDDAAIVTDSLQSSAGTAEITGNQLTWSGPLDIDVVTVTYRAQVAAAPAGDRHLINSVAPTGDGGVCGTPASCETDTPIRQFHVVKTADTSTANPGAQVTYTIVVTNTGGTDYPASAPASFTDSLSGVLDDASYNGDVQATGGTAQVVGNILSWSGALSNPGTVTITYSVTIDSPVRGDFALDNQVRTPPGSGGNCVSGNSDPDCEWTVLVRAYHLTKTVDRTDIAPGMLVTYTIEIENIGQVAYGPGEASLTDDLTQVLDDATYNGDASATAGTVSYAEPVLSWNGALAVGGTARISYTVTVNTPDTGNQQLHNRVVTPADSGSNCEPDSTDPLCEANVPGPRLHVVKSASSDSASPGQQVTYTIELENTGAGDFTESDPASFTDDLSEVLDDAVYNNDADQGATYSAQTLSWSGPLDSGDVIVITYSVTVEAGGDGYLDNTVVTPPTVTSNCTVGSSDPDCFHRVILRTYDVAKASDAGSSSQLGQVVTYTITVTNTGNAPYTVVEPAGFRDDMTDVLDDAGYNDDATNGATFSSPTLSWSGPLGVGDVAQITYSLTMNEQRTGNGHVYNAVRSTAIGGVFEANCRPGQAGEECWTLTSLPEPPLPRTGMEMLGLVGSSIAAILIGGGLLFMVSRRRLMVLTR